MVLHVGVRVGGPVPPVGLGGLDQADERAVALHGEPRGAGRHHHQAGLVDLGGAVVGDHREGGRVAEGQHDDLTVERSVAELVSRAREGVHEHDVLAADDRGPLVR
ncbi:hypothetical protein [Actinomadura madurae]|uniref:hypothetical protein n=1 Tax=Actinomadura madurae TaxID=1993 RepID=UPI0020D1F755|nr:hypothetical protein [Actinomadura madurae]MCQ0006605.1 hypothetical protein [Actinomadura madurae]MCQ0018097.1 hypothetical protein [Actinomadura madurae]